MSGTWLYAVCYSVKHDAFNIFQVVHFSVYLSNSNIILKAQNPRYRIERFVFLSVIHQVTIILLIIHEEKKCLMLIAGYLFFYNTSLFLTQDYRAVFHALFCFVLDVVQWSDSFVHIYNISRINKENELLNILHRARIYVPTTYKIVYVCTSKSHHMTKYQQLCKATIRSLTEFEKY